MQVTIVVDWMLGSSTPHIEESIRPKLLRLELCLLLVVGRPNFFDSFVRHAGRIYPLTRPAALGPPAGKFLALNSTPFTARMSDLSASI